MVGGRRPSRPVVALLAPYPPEMQDLALRTRALVRGSLPEIVETADFPARLIGYSYGPGYPGVVCAMILGRQGLKLGFNLGATLPDPAGLLAGKGRVHRHVVVGSAADLKKVALKKLLKVAGAAAKERLAGGSARG
jgi:hypothetical protein